MQNSENHQPDVQARLGACEIYVNGQTEPAFVLRGRGPLKKPVFHHTAEERVETADELCDAAVEKLGYPDAAQLAAASITEEQIAEARDAGATMFQINTFMDAPGRDLEYVVGDDSFLVDRVEFYIDCEFTPAGGRQ